MKDRPVVRAFQDELTRDGFISADFMLHAREGRVLGMFYPEVSQLALQRKLHDYACVCFASQ